LRPPEITNYKGQAEDNKAVHQHLEVAHYEQDKHEVVEDLRVLGLVTLVASWVEELVSIDQPEEEGAIEDYEGYCRVKVVVAVVVSHYPLLDKMRERPESQYGEVHQTPSEYRDSTIDMLAKLVDNHADKNVEEDISPDPFLHLVLFCLSLPLLAHLWESDPISYFSWSVQTIVGKKGLSQGFIIRVQH
jgi:hypothetical protein